ncbi:MATE family efflux transporter [Gilvibacter sediminis]|uniref:MATE family efflux transporter n=1 Tax=Gilvibacter sediminis TaxID=379071 RepID=UPI00235073D0|nr:MATE family efflux transporter [Gilvibacter sediminis]MDC7996877.1 MATE family efflux transporter [Gilvibacter sediminis]
MVDISFKRIQQLAIPAIISGIAEPVLSLTDTAVVGNIPEFGKESLAAAGIVGTLLSTFIWVLGQSRSAITAIISQNLGAGNLEKLRSFPAQAVFFNVLTSLIILASTYFFSRQIFILMEADGRILDYSVDYYNIRVWGFPLTLYTFAIFGIFRGLQNTFWPMIVATTGVVVNIILDFALVYGVEGLIDPMNIKGAAWASLIAQAVMAILVTVLLKTKTKVSLRFKKTLHPEVKRLVSMWGNLVVRSLALNAALILAVREATSLGDNEIAGYTIAINLWLFAAFFLDGYGAAGNILGGRLLGGQDYKGLWSLTKKVCGYNLVVSAILITVGIIFYTPLGVLFNKEPEVLAVYNDIFWYVLVSMPISAMAFTLDAVFKGLGEMKYLRNVLLGSTILGFIPTLFISKYFDLQMDGIWYALLVWILYRALALIVKYKNKYYVLAKK